MAVIESALSEEEPPFDLRMSAERGDGLVRGSGDGIGHVAIPPEGPELPSHATGAGDSGEPAGFDDAPEDGGAEVVGRLREGPAPRREDDGAVSTEEEKRRGLSR